MWLKLRQIALVAEQLAPVEKTLCDVLGINVCYRDPGVAHFGLENALFPIGNQLLEVVAPIQENTAGGRYLTRRGGDGGYMVITQCDDHAPRRARVEALGIRLAHQFETSEFRNMQLHPKDTGITFFEIDEQLGSNAHADDGPWEPAGPDWQRAKSDTVSGIVAAELQCDDPSGSAQRWADIAQLSVDSDQQVDLANATLRFVPCTDGRPEGLGGIDIASSHSSKLLQAGEAAGVRSGDSQLHICGMRMNIISI